ncbi:MAG: hypothetical protein QM601_06285 [Pseudoxanthomonas sp.]
MTDESTLAARLYGPTPANSTTSTTERTAAEPDLQQRLYGHRGEALPAVEPKPEVQASVEELLAEQSQSAEGVLYGVREAGPGTSYDTPVLEGFVHLERQAADQNSEEGLTALAEGKREAVAILTEMRVPQDDASELVRELAHWHGREPLSGEGLRSQMADTEAELRRSWGRHYQANLLLAQRAAKDAMRRLPWLEGILENGAGNEPAVVKHFAAIGLRNARRAKR